MTPRKTSVKPIGSLSGFLLGLMALGIAPNAISSPPPALPPIDTELPAATETATFALG
jgi:hypothetical protein